MKIKLLTWLLATFLLCGTSYLILHRSAESPKVLGQAAIIEITPEEFLKAEVLKQGLTNRDYIILHAVIQCESSWQQRYPDGTVKVSNGNVGLFQINVGAHQAEYKFLELDPFEDFDNLQYGVKLYKREGLRPWRQWSGHCWLPILKKQGIIL